MIHKNSNFSVDLYGCRTWFLTKRKTHTKSLETLSSGTSTLHLFMEAHVYEKYPVFVLKTLDD